jgi:hypothetical protein
MSRATVYLLLAGFAELVLATAGSRVVDRHDTYPVFLALYVAMGVCWLYACHLVYESRDGSFGERRFVVAAMVISIGMRVPLLLTEPVLSDDIFRYVWDGRVANTGINPYLYSPDSSELSPLRDTLYPGINNKDIPTIYPPLMQRFFAAVTTLSPSVLAMKSALLFVETALIVLLFAMCSGIRAQPQRALVYAWCPLAVVEVSGSGHNDVLAVWLLMGALWALHKGRSSVSMALLAGSGMAKLVGYGLAPLFVRASRLRGWLVMGAITLALAWPYRDAGLLAFRGLREYGTRWRSNDSLFHVLTLFVDSENAARVVVGVLLVAIVVTLVALRVPPLRSCYLTLGAILLLTPTVHPWYLLFLLPMLCFFESPAFLFLMVSVVLSYHSAYLSEPGLPWQDVGWVKALEYGPFFALLVHTTWRSVRSSGLRGFLAGDRLERPPRIDSHGAASAE